MRVGAQSGPAGRPLPVTRVDRAIRVWSLQEPAAERKSHEAWLSAPGMKGRFGHYLFGVLVSQRMLPAPGTRTPGKESWEEGEKTVEPQQGDTGREVTCGDSGTWRCPHSRSHRPSPQSPRPHRFSCEAQCPASPLQTPSGGPATPGCARTACVFLY